MIDGASIAHEYYLEGFHDDEIGSVDTCYHAISVWFTAQDAEIAGHGYAIQLTDSQGFVSTTLFDSHTQWEDEWVQMLDAHSECCGYQED